MKRREFRTTGIAIEPGGDGGMWFYYGKSLGGQRFESAGELKEVALPWIAERRRKLVREAAELEQVERYVGKLP